MSAGLAAFAIKRRRENQRLDFASDSMEREVATRVQARVMVDALIVGLSLGVVFLVANTAHPAIGVLTLVMFIVVDFYVRFAVGVRRTRGAD